MKKPKPTCSTLALLCLAVFALSGCTFFSDLFNPVTDMGSVPWTENALYLWDTMNLRFSFTFAPGGAPAGLDIQGTDFYSIGSPIGVAAVHAGLITFAAGGKVTIRIGSEQRTFQGSTRNGVTSFDFGSDEYYEFTE